ncbi:MAG: hypothetical protein HOL01_15510 [Planctomycetaceae bacterium]|nr:hypothetical protein [Planctomycetaceae bacterium]
MNDHPSGFAALSHRIRSRTTDLMAVAIVVVGGIGIGTQFSQWWTNDHIEPNPSLTAESYVSWGNDDTPVTLEFGNQPIQLQRQTIRGNRNVALAKLVEIGANVAENTTSPVTDIQPAEQKLLGLLQRQTPVREQPGVWRVYQIERPMTLVIATRRVKPSAESSRIADDRSVSKPQPDQSNRRVVCWGMAQPNQEDLWVLFTMRPTVAAAEPRPESGQVELPKGARKILSLRDASGGALTTFEGDAIATDWKLWFNDWFARRGWRSSQRWVESPIGWSAAFVPTEDHASGRIDISFSPAGEKRLSGMISITTPAGATKTEVLQKGFHR